jgi:hypothetical protein
MLLPRFTIRTLFVITTVAAFVFLIAGTAYRGQNWAWGVTIGIASLALTALVHAAWFGIVWLFSQLPSAERGPRDTALPESQPSLSDRGITRVFAKTNDVNRASSNAPTGDER